MKNRITVKLVWADFEKILIGALLIVATLVVVYKFFLTGVSDQGMIYLIVSFLSAFVVRKGLTYWKPDRYNPKPKIEEKIDDIDEGGI